MDAITTSGLDFLARLGLDLRTGAGWFGIALWQYLLAIILITFALFARRMATRFLNRFVLPSISRLGGVYASRIIRALVQPLSATIGLFGLYLAAKVLMLPVGGAVRSVESAEFINQSFQVAVAAVAIWALTRLVDVLGDFLLERAKENDLPVEVPIIPLLQKSLKVFVILVGGLMVIQHMGYPIASLLGGLGIGGLAVALAAQDTLANVFGSVIVFTDKPFKVGDWVVIGDEEGFVESIGFRSTRIRTWPQSLVTLPNKTIANSRIENWSAMPIRQINFTLTVTYETSADQMEELVKGIRQIVAEHPGIDQGYYLVAFSGFGENGLEILIYCFTRSTAWKEHMQVRQEINLRIMQLVEKLGLSVALPSRRVYLSPPGKEQEVLSISTSRAMPHH